MSHVAQIPWDGVPAAIKAFRQRFKSDAPACQAYCRAALAIERVQLAAIAARAFARIAGGPDAQDLVDIVCDHSLALANRYGHDGDPSARTDCLRAALVAADGEQSVVDRSVRRVGDSVKVEEATLQPGEVRPAALFQEFDALVEAGTHAEAVRVAERMRHELTGRMSVQLVNSLQQVCNALIDEGRDMQAAASYFETLSRLVDRPERIERLGSRLARALAAALSIALRGEQDWSRIAALAETLRTLSPADPLVLRATAFLHVHEGRAAECLAALDAMNAAAPDDAKWVLHEARRRRRAGSNATADTLYAWLMRAGHETDEARRVLTQIRGGRLRHLQTLGQEKSQENGRGHGQRNGDDPSSQDVLAAAEAVLDVNPHEKRALLAGAQALLQRNAPERARTMLQALLAIDPAHVGAQRLLASCREP